MVTYRLESTELVHLLAQQPQIKRFVIDRGNGYAGVTLLLVETIQRFEEVDLSARRCFDRIESLQSRLESESLKKVKGEADL